jgi:hypothetical protein
MKRPIEPADIRAGDLIRCEWPDDSASEWRSKTSGPAGWNADRVSYFLLDRPTPPVDLPTESLTWGTLVADRVQYEGLFQRESSVILHVGTGRRDEPRIPIESVTTWAPHVAVPRAALDKLRKAENVVRGVNDFLAAVDEATRA